MKYLTAYVERVNFTARFMEAHGASTKTYNARNLTAKDRDELLAKIECDLSPENLCCDGELRGAKLRAKALMINGAKAALQRLATQVYK